MSYYPSQRVRVISNHSHHGYSIGAILEFIEYSPAGEVRVQPAPNGWRIDDGSAPETFHGYGLYRHEVEPIEPTSRSTWS